MQFNALGMRVAYSPTVSHIETFIIVIELIGTGKKLKEAVEMCLFDLF